MSKVKKNISNERALSIIQGPIMTEKSTNLNQFNKYSFVVSKNSNSYEIKQAIESIFKVKVEKINTHGGSLRIYVKKDLSTKIQKSVKLLLDEEEKFGIKNYEAFGQ